MKSNSSRISVSNKYGINHGTLIYLIFLLLFIIIPLCVSPEWIYNRDVVVEKVNTNGKEEWQVKIDSGFDDFSEVILEFPEGYIVGGTFMYNDARGRCASEKPCDYAQKYPRIIWVRKDGNIAQDSIYVSDRLSGEPVSFFQTFDGKFISGSDRSIVKLGENKKVLFKKIFDGFYYIFSIIETPNRDYTLVGLRARNNTFPPSPWIASISQNGEFLWEYYFPNTSTFREVADAGDGAYLIADDENRLYFMDSSGHLSWNRSGLGEIWAMRPSGDGYQILVPGRSYDLNKDGNITRSVSFKAIDPVIWTKDGGFAAVSIGGENIVLTRFDQDGKVLWQQGNPNQHRAKPVSLIETSDGGFAILLTVNNKTPGT